MSKEEWLKEARYIEEVSPQKPGKLFNYDADCFKRYVKMQTQFCVQDGFPEIADRIKSYLKVD